MRSTYLHSRRRQICGRHATFHYSLAVTFAADHSPLLFSQRRFPGEASTVYDYEADRHLSPLDSLPSLLLAIAPHAR